MKRILITLAMMAMVPLTTARAQVNDKAYCAQLTDLYRRYVQNAPGRGFDVEASVALEDCRKGNAAASIPVLEKKLRENLITPPGGGEFKP